MHTISNNPNSPLIWDIHYQKSGLKLHTISIRMTTRTVRHSQWTIYYSGAHIHTHFPLDGVNCTSVYCILIPQDFDP